MSDYRQRNGYNYGTDYVPGPGEQFFGDAGKCDFIISTHNVQGRREEDILAAERKIAEFLPEGATIERHQNGDGSITLIEKIPSRDHMR